jgi:hypothetical protein
LREDGFEAFDGAEGDYVGLMALAFGDFLGSFGDYIDVGECKGAGYFVQEGGLFVIGFDQGEVDVGGIDF